MVQYLFTGTGSDMKIYVLTVQGYDCAYEDWTTRLVTTDICKIRDELKTLKMIGHQDCAIDVWQNDNHIKRKYYEYDLTGKN